MAYISSRESKTLFSKSIKRVHFHIDYEKAFCGIGIYGERRNLFSEDGEVYPDKCLYNFSVSFLFLEIVLTIKVGFDETTEENKEEVTEERTEGS